MTPSASNNNLADQLEPSVPVFPLSGALLLPNSQLPLNIFEPRYLAMVDAAMAKNGLIGMVQPREQGKKPACYDVGCVGKIMEYGETDDGRYMIALGGMCRFSVVEELAVVTPFRQFRVDYSPFRKADLTPASTEFLANRDGLTSALKAYLGARDLSCDWDAVSAADDESLINGLCMIAPFGTPEKQALLEAETLEKRAILLHSLLEFEVAGGHGASRPH